MGAPVPEMEPVESAAAEMLLGSFRGIAAAERRRHATVLNYWLSIRGDAQFAQIRDLDPLEISDAGPCSVLVEMIGGGEDADIRHIGQAIGGGIEAGRISEAPNPSLLACIASKLPIVAATRQAFAFEDEFASPQGTTRCWVTLLPFSSTGTWIDFVYGFVSLDPAPGAAAETEAAIDPVEDAPEAEPVEAEQVPEAEPDSVETIEIVEGESAPATELAPEPAAAEQAPAAEPAARPGFSAKLLDTIADVAGFYGTHARAEPNLPSAPFPEDVPAEPDCPTEGPLQNKLDEVRAKADEARMAKIRSNVALLEGLSAAYDFALDAEEAPEEYLKLVESQGLRIQLRSPMAPVAKLAFDGMCDDATIGQLEAVLAWALKRDLPRGSLVQRIEAEGGIGAIVHGIGRES